MCPKSVLLSHGGRYPPKLNGSWWRSVSGSDRLHWEIKEAVNASGRAYISSTVLDGRRVFRSVVMNPRTTERDIVQVMKEVERAARRV